MSYSGMPLPPQVTALTAYLDAIPESAHILLYTDEGVRIEWSNEATRTDEDHVIPPRVVQAAVDAFRARWNDVSRQGGKGEARNGDGASRARGEGSGRKRRQLDLHWHLTPIDDTLAVLQRSTERPLLGSDERSLAPLQQLSSMSSLKLPIDLVELLAPCQVPSGTSKEDQMAFLRQFMAVDWAKTALGPMESWTSLFWSHVILALLTPTPVLFVWGEEKPGVMIYNAAYSKVAGSRHPRILGMRYDEGWPDVWHQIQPFVDKAYAGNGTYFEDILMLLERDGRTEEFMAPIYVNKGGRLIVNGVYIPNSEQTASVITRRRLRLLNTLNVATAASLTLDQYWTASRQAMESSEIAMDLPFCAIYAVPSEVAAAHNAAQEDSDASSDEPGFWFREFEALFEVQRRRGSDTPEAPTAELHLVTPPIHGANMPSRFNTLRSPSSTANTDVARAEALLRPLINRLRQGEKQIYIGEEECCVLFDKVTQPPQAWPADDVRAAVICSLEPVQQGAHLRPGPARDSLTAFGIFALNSRRPYDSDYADFVRVLCSQLTPGLLNITSVTERIFNAQYLAWSTHQQHEEIKTELEKRTKEWRRSEAHFERIFSLIPAGIWVASGPQSSITWTNKAWYSISGHPADVSPDLFMDSVHEKDLAATKEVWSASVMPEHREGEAVQQQSVTFRWKGTTSEGLERWCNSTAIVEMGDDGYPVITGVLQDLSHLKYAEQVQRARADDAVQRKLRLNSFIDLLSHELRNPLGAISSGVELVSDRLGDDRLPVELRAACQEELSTVSHCLSHIHRLVDETLHMSKAEHDLVNLVMKEFEPEALARQTLRLFQSDTNAKGIALALRIGDGIERCRAHWLISDSGRIAQILINLLTNSVKFVADRPKREVNVSLDASITVPRLGGRIIVDPSVSTSPKVSPDILRTTAALAEAATASTPQIEESEKVYLRFDVEDTGIGLDAEQQQMLFRKWEQAMTPKTEKTYGGSGLGLYFSRKLAGLLDGQCGLQSESGVGSTFSFYVTCRRAHAPRRLSSSSGSAAAPSGPSTPMATSNAPYQILLVEDNLINQRLLARQLSRAGCEVTTADDGQYALDVLLAAAKSGRSFHICAMDVEMPRLNGLEATQRVRQLEAEGQLPGRLPILGVSANARDEQRDLMLASGMTSTIPKPFKLAALLEKIQEVLSLPP